MPIVMSLTPSLTVFIILFLFDDDTAASLEAPMRMEFRTRIYKDPLIRPWHIVQYILMGTEARLGHSISTPDLIRRKAVKSHLQNLETSCINWVHVHFPGAFSSLPGSRTPTAALLVTEKVSPMSAESRKIMAFQGLALDRDYDTWESDEWPGVRLVLPRDWDDEGNRLVFACRRHDAFPDSPGYQDPTSNWTIAQRAHDHIEGLLSRWSITCLLDKYHEALSALRDRSAHDGRYRPVRDLKELRSLARTMLYDIGACTQEIVDFSESDINYRYEVMEMFYVRTVQNKKTYLLNGFKSSQNWRARQVQRESALLLSTLSTSNDLSQTISNIRIQRLLVLLALVSIGIALWAAFLTAK